MKIFGNCFSAIYLCPIKAMMLRLKLKTMKNLQKTIIQDLLRDYNSYASKLLKYTDRYWDNMHYDIQGYSEALEEDWESINWKALLEHLTAVKMLYNAHKSLNYIYG